jgi:phytoene synthase
MLDPFPWTGMTAELVRVRGRILFGLGTRLLGGQADYSEAAGAIWSLVDVARHCNDPESREMLLAEARKSVAKLGPRKPARGLRPLTALAAVAAHDAFGGSGAGRGFVALIHTLTGRLPHG